MFFDHENLALRAKSAAHCISLNIFVKEAEQVLKNIAEDPLNGIFGFDAEMTLKVWKDQGYLKIYL